MKTAASQANAKNVAVLTIPAGTRSVIRPVEDVDTRRHGAIQTYPFDFGNYNLGSRAGTA